MNESDRPPPIHLALVTSLLKHPKIALCSLVRIYVCSYLFREINPHPPSPVPALPYSCYVLDALGIDRQRELASGGKWKQHLKLTCVVTAFFCRLLRCFFFFLLFFSSFFSSFFFFFFFFLPCFLFLSLFFFVVLLYTPPYHVPMGIHTIPCVPFHSGQYRSMEIPFCTNISNNSCIPHLHSTFPSFGGILYCYMLLIYVHAKRVGTLAVHCWTFL